MKHRREFIKTTSAAVLALGMAPVTAAASQKRLVSRRRNAALSNLHCADFAELLGTPFYVTESSGAVSSVLLAEAEDLSAQYGGENFSLSFRGALDRPLSSGTYVFEHRRLGTFGLFIVPMRGDGRNAHYEAVFNRIT
jgi:hypothetical protein